MGRAHLAVRMREGRGERRRRVGPKEGKQAGCAGLHGENLGWAKTKREKGKGEEKNGLGQKKVMVGCKGEGEGERKGKCFFNKEHTQFT